MNKLQLENVLNGLTSGDRQITISMQEYLRMIKNIEQLSMLACVMLAEQENTTVKISEDAYNKLLEKFSGYKHKDLGDGWHVFSMREKSDEERESDGIMEKMVNSIFGKNNRELDPSDVVAEVIEAISDVPMNDNTVSEEQPVSSVDNLILVANITPADHNGTSSSNEYSGGSNSSDDNGGGSSSDCDSGSCD